jgi:hypothetical protein
VCFCSQTNRKQHPDYFLGQPFVSEQKCALASNVSQPYRGLANVYWIFSALSDMGGKWNQTFPCRSSVLFPETTGCQATAAHRCVSAGGKRKSQFLTPQRLLRSLREAWPLQTRQTHCPSQEALLEDSIPYCEVVLTDNLAGISKSHKAHCPA